MKFYVDYPVIDLGRTGENIRNLRMQRGLSVNDIREFIGLNDPQAIYHWQNGKNLPSVDHLCALAKLFGVSMDEILVLQKPIVDSSRGGQKKEKAILSHVLQCCLLQAA